MDPIRVDLVALRRPVEYQFPNEKWFRIEPYRGHGKAMLTELRRDPENNLHLVIELLRLAVPTATDEDFDCLSPDEDVPRVLAAADGKAAQMEAFLKNVTSDGGLVTPSLIPRSSPMMTFSTSSGTSPVDTGNRGSPSLTPTGTKRSSPTRRSKRSSASSGLSKTGETSATSASP